MQDGRSKQRQILKWTSSLVVAVPFVLFSNLALSACSLVVLLPSLKLCGMFTLLTSIVPENKRRSFTISICRTLAPLPSEEKSGLSQSGVHDSLVTKAR